MNRTISENLSNTKNRDINIPLSPASFSKRTDGKWEYICGNCSYRFEEAPRCPECGQLLKKNIDIDKHNEHFTLRYLIAYFSYC